MPDFTDCTEGVALDRKVLDGQIHRRQELRFELRQSGVPGGVEDACSSSMRPFVGLNGDCEELRRYGLALRDVSEKLDHFR